MVAQDLREYLKMLEEIGELSHVDGADWNLEIGAISEIMAERGGPALLFDKIKDYPPGYRVASNLLYKERTASPACGLPPDLKGMAMIKAWREKLRNFKPIPPKEVSDGPVMENLLRGDEINLWKFPTPKWHELDGGRYLGTGSMMIIRDPDEGWVNAGCYRHQVHDKDKLGIYISPGHQGRMILDKYASMGKPAPVAISFGCDLTTYVACTYTVPWGVCEYDYSGFMRGEPVEVITSPVTGLPIPARDEIVVEGEVPPNELMMEGPFGEYSGYYAHGARMEPYLKVKAIYHRNDPIIHGYNIYKPPLIGVTGELDRATSIWDELEKAGIPDVRGVWLMKGGGPYGITVVSIRQRYPGHAKQAGLVAAGSLTGGYDQRFVIVVDDDIDPSNIDDVLWAMWSRCEPEEDINIINKAWSTYLDPRIPPEKKDKGDVTNSKAIIMACRPYSWMKDFPKVNRISKEIRTKTLEKWSHLLK